MPYILRKGEGLKRLYEKSHLLLPYPKTVDSLSERCDILPKRKENDQRERERGDRIEGLSEGFTRRFRNNDLHSGKVLINKVGLA